MPEEMYDILQRALADPRTFPPPGIAKTLGFTMTAVARGKATFEIDVDERLANPLGTLHGGVLCDLADAAMGIAYLSELDRGETFTTLELKINFLKPVWNTRLRAEARVVKRGRTVGLVECDVYDQTGSLVARASSTCLTLVGSQAAGR